ncbi:MAG: hypothetical protein Q7U73_16205 [Rubrivivax sp.]|nr:hypothetical protein [Rubrivivax sp.]
MDTDTLTDSASGCADTVPLPVSPYVALHPHYGMLLGVAEFEAEQAYHRGKQRLHNAWAHGWGVLWGLGVAVDMAKGEVAVAPGLALDGRGRELHNDLAQCLNVPRWFEAHRNDAGFEYTDSAGVIAFDAHVRIRHHACLTAPVPALADSCSNNASGTAYSRVYETVVIELVPGLAPPRSHRHHLLRVLAGLDAVQTDEDGNPLPDDQAAADARAAIAAAAPADRVAVAAAALHDIAVLDGIGETTATPDEGSDSEDDSAAGLFPVAGPTTLALADLHGVTLTSADGGSTLAVASVDPRVRSVLLPTATLQALAGALLAALA